MGVGILGQLGLAACMAAALLPAVAVAQSDSTAQAVGRYRQALEALSALPAATIGALSGEEAEARIRAFLKLESETKRTLEGLGLTVRGEAAYLDGQGVTRSAEGAANSVLDRLAERIPSSRRDEALSGLMREWVAGYSVVRVTRQKVADTISAASPARTVLQESWESDGKPLPAQDMAPVLDGVAKTYRDRGLPASVTYVDGVVSIAFGPEVAQEGRVRLSISRDGGRNLVYRCEGNAAMQRLLPDHCLQP